MSQQRKIDSDLITKIVPLVKAGASHTDGIQHVELPKSEMPIARPFVGDLIIMYAEDKPDRFEFISARRLSELGLNEEELHEIALRNLQSKISEINLHGEFPKFMITCGGNFESTLMLFEDLWDSLGSQLEGNIMVAVPSRDLLYISTDSWDGAYQFLSELAHKELEDKRYELSKMIFVKRDSGWQVASDAS